MGYPRVAFTYLLNMSATFMFIAFLIYAYDVIVL